MADIAPHVRAVHAGIGELYARMKPEEATNLLQQWMREKTLHFLNHKREPLSEILWAGKKNILTPETAADLKEQGVGVIVHGHKSIRDCIQTLRTEYGIAVMNGDVGIGRSGQWGYIRIDEDGRFIAASKDGGERPFGQLTVDGYIPPAFLED